MTDLAAPIRHHQQIGRGVAFAGLEEQDRALGRHLPGDAVADGGVPNGLVRGKDDLGRGAEGAVDAIDGARRIGQVADAAVLGHGGRGQGEDGGAEQRSERSHRITSGSER